MGLNQKVLLNELPLPEGVQLREKASRGASARSSAPQRSVALRCTACSPAAQVRKLELAINLIRHPPVFVRCSCRTTRCR